MTDAAAPIRVLIVDDEIRLTRSLAFALRQAGFDCLQSHSAAMGCEIAGRERPDVILLDVRMPGISGLDALETLRHEAPNAPVIMMSALDASRDAVTAMRRGAADYIAKPFDVDELIAQIARAHDRRRNEAEEVARAVEPAGAPGGLLGASAAACGLRERLDRLAAGPAPVVMLTGETGAGRALAARELHRRAHGEAAPFVQTSCATLSEPQLAVELFGDETPGAPPRRGLLALAEGGTLFLHEVDALPPALQARLTAFLETGAWRPEGGLRDRRARLRLIVTAEADLAAAAQAGRFRRDLALRLGSLPVEIPPLRARAGDVPLIAGRFARDFARAAGLAPVRFAPTAMARMQAHGWPGNLRELKNLVERLTILHPGEEIGPALLPPAFHDLAPAAPATIEERMQDVERDLVREALAGARGRKGIAADRLGISRHALKRRMQKLGLA